MARQRVPNPTPIYRMAHIDNLSTLLVRGVIHAPNRVPDDGLPYRSIHAMETQLDRANVVVPCGPCGCIRDYVGFYFGPRSPMLFRLHTGYNVQQVEQSKIIYLVSSAQTIAGDGLDFVFTDRHSLAAVASFMDDLDELSEIDFQVVNARQWNSTAAHPDRQEKKQAEFLVHESMSWELIEEIGVLNAVVKRQVERILDEHADAHRPDVRVQRGWYY